jgi:hypothetical protein
MSSGCITDRDDSNVAQEVPFLVLQFQRIGYFATIAASSGHSSALMPWFGDATH